MSPMPDHVVRYLVESGVLAPGGIGRTARPRTCRRCGALTIVGLDHDRCASVAHVDPTPLTPAGEAAALLAGRPTYALHAHRGAYVIDERNSFHIRGNPAGQLERGDVVAAHRCHAPALSATHSHIPAPVAAAASDHCPF